MVRFLFGWKIFTYCSLRPLVFFRTDVTISRYPLEVPTANCTVALKQDKGKPTQEQTIRCQQQQIAAQKQLPPIERTIGE